MNAKEHFKKIDNKRKRLRQEDLDSPPLDDPVVRKEHKMEDDKEPQGLHNRIDRLKRSDIISVFGMRDPLDDPVVQEAVKLAKQPLVLLDCRDNSCHFTEVKGGQRTNGGCRCLPASPNWKQAQRLAVAKLLHQRDIFKTALLKLAGEGE